MTPSGKAVASIWQLNSRKSTQIKLLRSSFWRRCSILTSTLMEVSASIFLNMLGHLSMMWAVYWPQYSHCWQIRTQTPQPTQLHQKCLSAITKSIAHESGLLSSKVKWTLTMGIWTISRWVMNKSMIWIKSSKLLKMLRYWLRQLCPGRRAKRRLLRLVKLKTKKKASRSEQKIVDFWKSEGRERSELSHFNWSSLELKRVDVIGHILIFVAI